MASKLTLDSIREAAELKYGNQVLDLGGEEITLLNPLRLSKEKRKALSELEQPDAEEDVDEIDYFEKVFALVSSEAEAKKIRAALGDDVTLYAALLEAYYQAGQVGEASHSQD